MSLSKEIEVKSESILKREVKFTSVKVTVHPTLIKQSDDEKKYGK